METFCTLADYMEHNPSCKANRFPTTQKFPAYFGNRMFISAYTTAATSSLSQLDTSGDGGSSINKQTRSVVSAATGK